MRQRERSEDVKTLESTSGIFKERERERERDEYERDRGRQRR